MVAVTINKNPLEPRIISVIGDWMTKCEKRQHGCRLDVILIHQAKLHTKQWSSSNEDYKHNKHMLLLIQHTLERRRNDCEALSRIPSEQRQPIIQSFQTIQPDPLSLHSSRCLPQCNQCRMSNPFLIPRIHRARQQLDNNSIRILWRHIINITNIF